jgi:hypothetical protein
VEEGIKLSLQLGFQHVIFIYEDVVHLGQDEHLKHKDHQVEEAQAFKHFGTTVDVEQLFMHPEDAPLEFH